MRRYRSLLRRRILKIDWLVEWDSSSHSTKVEACTLLLLWAWCCACEQDEAFGAVLLSHTHHHVLAASGQCSRQDWLTGIKRRRHLARLDVHEGELAIHTARRYIRPVKAHTRHLQCAPCHYQFFCSMSKSRNVYTILFTQSYFIMLFYQTCYNIIIFTRLTPLFVL